jgi:hypothetical protein
VGLSGPAEFRLGAPARPMPCSRSPGTRTCGEMVHGTGDQTSHSLLYSTPSQRQNQGSADLEANLTQRPRGMALQYARKCSRPSGSPSGSSTSSWVGASAPCRLFGSIMDACWFIVGCGRLCTWLGSLMSRCASTTSSRTDLVKC